MNQNLREAPQKVAETQRWLLELEPVVQMEEAEGRAEEVDCQA